MHSTILTHAVASPSGRRLSIKMGIELWLIWIDTDANEAESALRTSLHSLSESFNMELTCVCKVQLTSVVSCCCLWMPRVEHPNSPKEKNTETSMRLRCIFDGWLFAMGTFPHWVEKMTRIGCLGPSTAVSWLLFGFLTQYCTSLIDSILIVLLYFQCRPRAVRGRVFEILPVQVEKNSD